MLFREYALPDYEKIKEGKSKLMALENEFKKDPANYYDKNGEEYDNCIEAYMKGYHYHLLDLLEEYDIPKDARIMNFGTGTGIDPVNLHAKGYT